MPTPEQVEWLLKTGSIYGLGFIAIAGLLVMVFYGSFRVLRSLLGLIEDIRNKWAPEVVSGHLTFIETTKVNSIRTADAVEKLTESTTVSHDNHGKTHRALECIAKAQLEDCCDKAREYLDDAINELK